MKRQWRDSDGVVHSMWICGRLRHNYPMGTKCGKSTPSQWYSTSDAPTCLACVSARIAIAGTELT